VADEARGLGTRVQRRDSVVRIGQQRHLGRVTGDVADLADETVRGHHRIVDADPAARARSDADLLAIDAIGERSLAQIRTLLASLSTPRSMRARRALA